MSGHVLLHVALHETLHKVALAHVAHELDRWGLRGVGRKIRHHQKSGQCRNRQSMHPVKKTIFSKINFELPLNRTLFSLQTSILCTLDAENYVLDSSIANKTKETKFQNLQNCLTLKSLNESVNYYRVFRAVVRSFFK